jgi:hypothetical protein
MYKVYSSYEQDKFTAIVGAEMNDTDSNLQIHIEHEEVLNTLDCIVAMQQYSR